MLQAAIIYLSLSQLSLVCIQQADQIVILLKHRQILGCAPSEHKVARAYMTSIKRHTVGWHANSHEDVTVS